MAGKDIWVCLTPAAIKIVQTRSVLKEMASQNLLGQKPHIWIQVQLCFLNSYHKVKIKL